MADISQLATVEGWEGEGEWGSKLPIYCTVITLPGSGRGAGRRVAFPPLGYESGTLPRDLVQNGVF